jgi:hypothetical protein
MLRIASMLFAAVLAAVGWFIVTTTRELPSTVATHFGPGFLANGGMARDDYLVFSLTFSILVPLVVAGIVGWIPRLFPKLVNVPNRDYWLAPERRAATLESLALSGIALGALLSTFMGGVHWLILKANAVVPPRLPANAFWTLMVAFLVLLTVWIGALWTRFRNVAN